MRNRILAGLVAFVFILVTALPLAAAEQAQVIGTYTLPNIPLADAQNKVLNGSITNDRGILLGGIGSDMWHAAGEPDNTFWMITDRGPNGQISVDGANRRTFPVPEFTPLILHVTLDAPDQVTVQQVIPLVGQSGKPVTGMSNLARDEKPYDYAAQNAFPLNPSGLDTEGLVRTSAGDFWIAEEYGPSLVHVDASGKVLKRYVPEGIDYTGADYPVVQALPAIYGKRKINRGFEGLASADGKTLYAILQSPLTNPSKDVGDPSRNTRILAFDIATEKPIAEYAYQFDDYKEFDPASPNAAEMKLSSVIALSPTQLLINERTDRVAKLYSVDLSQATNILGSKWDDPATSPSFEALADLAGAGITALPKTLVLNLDSIPNMPDKIEGMALVDSSTIAVANDNDFDMNNGSFDANGKYQGPGVASKVLVLKLSSPLTTSTAAATTLPTTGGSFENLSLILAAVALILLGLGLRRIARA